MLKKTIIVLLALLFVVGFQPQRINAEEQVVKAPSILKQYVKHIFGDNAEVAMAVFKHESGLRSDAVNYNCTYENKDGKRYSTFCKKGDKKNATSVDCGIGQTNVRGRVCPDELLTLEGNMQQVEKIYNEQGLKAWASYTNGGYKKFLE